jgi:hypothetical protein
MALDIGPANHGTADCLTSRRTMIVMDRCAASTEPATGGRPDMGDKGPGSKSKDKKKKGAKSGDKKK